MSASKELIAVANYFIWRANIAQERQETGTDMTHLKLQKLVYYAQGFSLAITGDVLFDECIRAWEHGPVVSILYDEFCSYGSGPVPIIGHFDPSSLDSRTRSLLEHVYEEYGHRSARELRERTHAEPPWRDTPPGKVISIMKMRPYFTTKLAHAKAMPQMPESLTVEEREYIIRSMLSSQALEGVIGTREEAEHAIDVALSMPLVKIG